MRRDRSRPGPPALDPEAAAGAACGGGRRRWPTSVCAALALALALSACRTQIWPGPMPGTSDPLPPGLAGIGPGLDEVVVTRLSDPVAVRPAGTVGIVPLPYVAKRRRLLGGSSIHLSAGGRVEVAWPGEGLIVHLFDAGHLRVGVRERGEPALYLDRPTRATFELPGGTRVAIVDACEIVVPEGPPAGPLRLERGLNGTLRLFNNGAAPIELDMGDARLSLGASQSLDLVEIDPRAGRARRGRGILSQRLPLGDGTVLRWEGPLALSARAGSVWLGSGAGAVELDAAGSLWHLPAGGGVQLTTDPSFALTPARAGASATSAADASTP